MNEICGEKKPKLHLFDKIDDLDEISYGQRGFDRNLGRLNNQLIDFYNKAYP